MTDKAANCATTGCPDTPTHRVTVRTAYGHGEAFTADTCDTHTEHQREVDRLLRHPAPLVATVQTDHPDWRVVSVAPLGEVSA